jgi:hypothetical protein
MTDNISLYSLTNTGVSSARLYWENKADFFDAKPITIPFAISVFPDELYEAPRSWAERAYPKVGGKACADAVSARALFALAVMQVNVSTVSHDGSDGTAIPGQPKPPGER